MTKNRTLNFWFLLFLNLHWSDLCVRVYIFVTSSVITFNTAHNLHGFKCRVCTYWNESLFTYYSDSLYCDKKNGEIPISAFWCYFCCVLVLLLQSNCFFFCLDNLTGTIINIFPWSTDWSILLLLTNRESKSIFCSFSLSLSVSSVMGAGLFAPALSDGAS